MICAGYCRMMLRLRVDRTAAVCVCKDSSKIEKQVRKRKRTIMIEYIIHHIPVDHVLIFQAVILHTHAIRQNHPDPFAPVATGHQNLFSLSPSRMSMLG